MSGAGPLAKNHVPAMIHSPRPISHLFRNPVNYPGEGGFAYLYNPPFSRLFSNLQRENIVGFPLPSQWLRRLLAKGGK